MKPRASSDVRNREPWARAALLTLLAGALLAPAALATDPIQYARPVEAAPSVKDIGGGYSLPVVQHPQPRSQWHEVLDVVLLAAALALGTWLVLKRRSRRGIVVLTIGCLLYFGLYRQGCVCPIGAIQNVVVALTDPRYAIPYVVIAIFFLPLIAAVLFGRVFCGGVCPLGAIQDLVLLQVGGRGPGRNIPVRVPRSLDKSLGSLKWVYLLLAIWFAVGKPVTASASAPSPAEISPGQSQAASVPTTDAPASAAATRVRRDFIICRFDPFVGFFRFAGPTHMLLIGAGFLVLGLFVGRPYCRYLCPYGAILSLLARLSWRKVSVTPDKELDCGLCAEACPFGAIESLRAVRSACLSCGRCFNACPRHRRREKVGK